MRGRGGAKIIHDSGPTKYENVNEGMGVCNFLASSIECNFGSTLMKFGKMVDSMTE